jgi:hypothetical protein
MIVRVAFHRCMNKGICSRPFVSAFVFVSKLLGPVDADFYRGSSSISTGKASFRGEVLKLGGGSSDI